MKKRQALFVIGIPGTGKTTVTNELRKWAALNIEVGPIEDRTIPLVPFEEYQSKISGVWRFIGVFPSLLNLKNQHYAQGTDKLSMGVQPKFLEFAEQQKANLYIEGDRLGNISVMRELIRLGYQVQIVVLGAENARLQKRYVKRGSTQKESFLKGRVTKVRNVMRWAENQPGTTIQLFPNNTLADLAGVVNHLRMRLLKEAP